MKKRKVAIIGSVGIPAKYGGFETLTEHLVEELSAEYDFTVYCSAKNYPPEERRSTYKGARLKYLPLSANGMQSIFYDTWSMLHAVFNSDVLLILGVAGAGLLPFLKTFTGRKIIVSIDGIEWKRDKWSYGAKLYLRWAEKLAVKHSHIDISDNESIQDYTALKYKTLSKVIEYGANHTHPYLSATAEDFQNYPFLAQKYAVKVCRIEPENNVHQVLQAFSELPHHTLVIIGNWGNSLYGKQLKSQYGSMPNFHLLDPIYNQRELDLLRGNAALYIHGHSAGGTNPSLVEAMYLGLPIIAFDVSFNRVSTENQAYYFPDVDGLKKLLDQLPDKDFAACAKKMKAISERRYSWQKIAQKYSQMIKESFESSRKEYIYAEASVLDEKTLVHHEAMHLRHNQIFESSLGKDKQP